VTSADSSALDSAILDLLASDPTLAGLLPGGIYFDIAPQNATQFCILSVMDEVDEEDFGGRVFEDVLYMVKVVELSTVSTKNIRPAAARIDDLLHRMQITATGFGDITARREQRIRQTEVDDVDQSIRWNHRGGQYRVMATLTPTGNR